MPYLFRPPVVWEGPLSLGPLFYRYDTPKGVSVLVTDGICQAVRFPSQDECAAADVVYLGGHEYVVDNDAALVLAECGFGPNLEPWDGYIDKYFDAGY